MNHRNRINWSVLSVLAVIAGTPNFVSAVPVTLDPPPVTSGLFVKLNGNNLASGTLSIWADQANDGNAGSFQNFVQATSGNQPTVAVNNMPNGLDANVVRFTRGTTSGSNNSTGSSDYLRSVAGGPTARLHSERILPTP